MRILLHETHDNPYAENSPGSTLATLNVAILGQLMDIDKYYNIYPRILERAYYDFKEKKYILKLRDKTYFHNGRLADSKDLEFSLLRGFFTKRINYFKMYFGNIEGLEEIEKQNITKFKSGFVSGVKIIDNLTLSVKLKEPNPDFLYSLIEPYFSLVAMEALEENYMTWKKYPVGAGPYKIVEPGYHDGETKLIKVQKDLKTGPDEVFFYTKYDTSKECDILAFNSKRENIEKYKLFESKNSISMNVINFNFNIELRNNENFRKFINAAIDRTELIKSIVGATEAYETLPKHYWGRIEALDPYNPKLASQYYQLIPKNLREKEWNLSVYSGKKITPQKKNVAENIKLQLSRYGFKINFYPSNDKFFSEITGQQTALRLAGTLTTMNDPLIAFSAYTLDSPYKNERPLQDEKLNSLYLRAKEAASKEERVASVKILSKYFIEKTYAVPLFEIKNAIFYNNNKIKSLGAQNQAHILDVAKIEMK
ncbi:ABC transporter substrate-binding protein [Fluviispira vulneris]|uniref:ABC transporter substrate-binding protein n=1 Tax=Fluviispira vulneris TaxID=2763012 RepID=UPI001647683B|nr:ABC transporter substrate-binding protein [Fluviispira vulneris]